MASLDGTARGFFEACETGKGWAACQAYCNPDASFSCQADALAGVRTLAAYCDWMQGLFGPVPDGSYEITAWGVDHERGTVVAAAIFSGTNSGEGGPVPATGKRIESDYVYVMSFDGERIAHVTKIWNSDWTLRAFGWA